MPQRHSKNNNDLAFFTYDEKKKLGYGTQRERLGKDSLKPFDACCLCLKTARDPTCCQKGHLFCKECIFESLVVQKKDIKRKVALWEDQEQRDKEEQEEKSAAAREAELEAFDRQNNSALPTHRGRAGHEIASHAGGGFHGANSVRTTAFEAEALRTMRAFWLPSQTPEAAERVDAPSTSTCCPEGGEKLRLKDLFSIRFSEDPHREKTAISTDLFLCPSCTTTFTNASTITVISSCGHVVCKKCADKFVAKDKACCVCSRAVKDKNLVVLEKGGTGFASHDEKALEAAAFKYLGSGTGQGLARPATRLL